MSIARTLDGKLSATLALIAIIGWLVVDIVEGYPVARPDMITAVIVIALAVIAFQFYREDRAAGKDPVTQKAQMDAAVEMFLEKLAKHRALAGQMNEGEDNPLLDLLRVLEKIGNQSFKPEKSEGSEGEHVIGETPTDEEFNAAIDQAKKEKEKRGNW